MSDTNQRFGDEKVLLHKGSYQGVSYACDPGTNHITLYGQNEYVIIECNHETGCSSDQEDENDTEENVPISEFHQHWLAHDYKLDRYVDEYFATTSTS